MDKPPFLSALGILDTDQARDPIPADEPIPEHTLQNIKGMYKHIYGMAKLAADSID
jgi:hypothetical protein